MLAVENSVIRVWPIFFIFKLPARVLASQDRLSKYALWLDYTGTACAGRGHLLLHCSAPTAHRPRPCTAQRQGTRRRSTPRQAGGIQATVFRVHTHTCTAVNTRTRLQHGTASANETAYVGLRQSCWDQFQVLCPPAVAHRLYLSARAAAIE